MLVTEKEQLIHEALLKGKRYDVIAKELGVSVKTITKVSKKIGSVSSLRVVQMLEQGKTPLQIMEAMQTDIKSVKQLWDDWAPMYDKAKQTEAEHEGKLDETLRVLIAVWGNVKGFCLKDLFPIFNLEEPCPRCGHKQFRPKKEE